MRFGKLGLIVVPWLMTAAPAVVDAQPSIDVNVNLTMPGEAIPSVDVFYDQLSPYGVWVDDSELGNRVFIPEETGYVPYTNGHWEYTDLGFVWVSDEPFAWATSHYGRWAFSEPYGRWVWLPDTQWGPAWVDWRETDGEFGWAPLAPQIIVDMGYQAPIDAWHYCPAEHILDVDVRRHYEPRERVVVVHREARPIEHRARVNNREVVAGPAPQKLREHRIAARPTKVEPHKIGLMTATEVRTATQRAQQRKPTIEAQNRKRVESNPTLREAEQRAKTRQPPKQAQNRTEPTRPEQKTDTRTDTTRTQPPRTDNRKETTRTQPPRTTTRPDNDTRTTRPDAPDTRTTRPETRTDTRPDTRTEPPTTRPQPPRVETRPDQPQPPRAEKRNDTHPQAPRADNRPANEPQAPRADTRNDNRPQAPRADTRPANPPPAPRAEKKAEPKRPPHAENERDKKKDNDKRD